jgi:hypothetical protein
MVRLILACALASGCTRSFNADMIVTASARLWDVPDGPAKQQVMALADEAWIQARLGGASTIYVNGLVGQLTTMAKDDQISKAELDRFLETWADDFPPRAVDRPERFAFLHQKRQLEYQAHHEQARLRARNFSRWTGEDVQARGEALGWVIDSCHHDVSEDFYEQYRCKFDAGDEWVVVELTEYEDKEDAKKYGTPKYGGHATVASTWGSHALLVQSTHAAKSQELAEALASDPHVEDFDLRSLQKAIRMQGFVAGSCSEDREERDVNISCDIDNDNGIAGDVHVYMYLRDELRPPEITFDHGEAEVDRDRVSVRARIWHPDRSRVRMEELRSQTADR